MKATKKNPITTPANEAQVRFPGSSRPLSKAEQTRLKILDATLESLCEHGIEKTTLQTIATHAGVGVSHVAYHFPEKSELIREAIQYDTLLYREVLEDFLRQARSPEEKLRAFLMANFHWHRSKRHRLTWLLEFYMSAQQKPLAQAYVESRLDGKRRIQEYIGPELIRRGFSYEQLEQEAFALQMMASGFLTDYIARYPLDPGPEYVTRAIDSVVNRIFSKT